MLRVLIADDESKVCQLIEKLVDWDALGMEVVAVAENGIEALEKIKEFHPDIVITDIRMPDVDGIGLMKQCRSQWANTSIVVISGYDDFKYAQQAIEYGASAYLLKPVDKQELYRVVEKAWQSANARRATIVNTSYSLFVNYLRGESSNAGILEQMKRTYPFLSGACATSREPDILGKSKIGMRCFCAIGWEDRSFVWRTGQK